MAVYGSVTFDVEIAGKIRPDWHAIPIIAEQDIPYSNVSDVQFGGLRSARIKVRVHITSDASWNTLKSYKGDGVGRSLTSFMGASFSNIKLIDVQGTRSDFEQVWDGEAEFLQGTS